MKMMLPDVRHCCKLKIRTWTRTEQKPYKCQLCQKLFSHISNLKTHIMLESCVFKLHYAWQQGMTTTKPSHPPNPPPNLTYPSLALSSTTFHSRLKTGLFKLSYPDSTPAPRHVRRHHWLQL